MHGSVGTLQVDLEHPVDLGRPLELAPDRVQRFRHDLETGKQGRPTGSSKPNGGRLVPDDVAGTEQLDQHDHVYGIDRPVKTSAKNRADVIPCPPRQRYANVDLTPVRSDICDSAPRAPVGGKQVEAPPEQACAPSLGNAPRARLTDGF